MKRHIKIIYILVFIIVFICSALIKINTLGSAPNKLLKVEWNNSVGNIYKYDDYDIYIPANIDQNDLQYLILFIHGGSFNSGSKEDGDSWCKYYASKGYICATVNYSLQSKDNNISIYTMNRDILEAVQDIKEQLNSQGYTVAGMAPCGVSAGGTLAMNLAYNNNSPIPVKFVFQLAAPTYFEPKDWKILMKVNKLKTQEEFLYMMTGKKITDYKDEIKLISPASLICEHTVPSLIGYGLKDHLVPFNQKEYLIQAYNHYDVQYDYYPFPNSNHGMYSDLDILQQFIDKSLEYCELYFK